MFQFHTRRFICVWFECRRYTCLRLCGYGSFAVAASVLLSIVPVRACPGADVGFRVGVGTGADADVDGYVDHAVFSQSVGRFDNKKTFAQALLVAGVVGLTEDRSQKPCVGPVVSFARQLQHMTLCSFAV